MLDVLFEDNHVLVVNKPAGLLVHGDETGDECLADVAKAYIKKNFETLSVCLVFLMTLYLLKKRNGTI